MRNIKLEPEEAEQKAVIDYINYRHPGTLFTISPQGMKLSRRKATVYKIIGYRAGTPDIQIFEARGAFHGLQIELKRPEKRDVMGKIYQTRGNVSGEQMEWIREANKRGYRAVICYGADQAIAVICAYLGSKI